MTASHPESEEARERWNFESHSREGGVFEQPNGWSSSGFLFNGLKSLDGQRYALLKNASRLRGDDGRGLTAVSDLP